MKTLLMALAAASFISTSASARFPPPAEGASYDVRFRPDEEPCQVRFDPHDEGDDHGAVSLTCDSSGDASIGEWLDVMRDQLNVEIPQIAVSGFWVTEASCEEWPSIDVGETVSDPCWMRSITGIPIEVTRTE
jgi:hypothetical protein